MSQRNDAAPGSRWKTVLETSATILMIAVAGTLLWRMLLENGRPAAAAAAKTAKSAAAPLPPPTEPLSLEGAALKGSAQAKVAIVVYSDFQCPYCGSFARDILPALEQKYVDSGKVLLAFREFPLESIHPFALKAAEAAECSGRQGKFWEMHDQLFGDQKHLDAAALQRRAEALSLDRAKFSACLEGQTSSKVAGDQAGGRTISVSGTPTFFVGTIDEQRRVRVVQRLTGALPLVQFGETIDRLLRVSEATGAK